MCISFFSLLIKSRLVYTRVRTLCAELGQGPQGQQCKVYRHKLTDSILGYEADHSGRIRGQNGSTVLEEGV